MTIECGEVWSQMGCTCVCRLPSGHQTPHGWTKCEPRPLAAPPSGKAIFDDADHPEDCPYCAGDMCARFDGLNCQHNERERHGYPPGYWEGFADGKAAAVSRAAVATLVALVKGDGE